VNELTIIAGPDDELDPALADLAAGDAVLVIADVDGRVLAGDLLTDLVAADPTTVLVAAPPSRAWLGSAAGVLAARSGDRREVVDIGGEVFLTLDGSGTDHVVVGGLVVATATGRRPSVVLGPPGALGPLDEALDADGTADLARVLGYVDAADPGNLVDVAPDILSTPFWTTSMCHAVIAAVEAVDAWGSDAADPVPGLELSLATISPVLFANLEAHLRSMVLPEIHRFWPTVADTGVHDAFVIKYAAGERTAALPLHHDVAQISGSVRLNAGYDGGVLEFPRQSFANRDVEVGSLLLWPSLVTHPHRSTPVTRGVKYGLTIWFGLPGG